MAYELMDMKLYSQEFGHRVRLATHANFKDFVRTAGLEFFPLGGDPKVLAGCKCLSYSKTHFGCSAYFDENPILALLGGC